MTAKLKKASKMLPPGWLDRQLVPSLTAAQRRMDKRAFLAAMACAFVSAIGAVVCVSIMGS